MVITIAYRKGGTGKTNTAAHLGLALDSEPDPERPGRRRYRGRVGLVDADPQASLYRWSRAEDWPLPTIHWPVRDLARRVGQIEGNHPYLVIDTPPGEGDVPITRQAIMAASLVVIPVGPEKTEISELQDTLDLVNELAELRPVPLGYRIMLTRVDARTQDGPIARRVLENPTPRRPGLPLLKAEVGDRRRYSRAYGTLPADLGEYMDVATELKEIINGAP